MKNNYVEAKGSLLIFHALKYLLLHFIFHQIKLWLGKISRNKFTVNWDYNGPLKQKSKDLIHDIKWVYI